MVMDMIGQCAMWSDGQSTATVCLAHHYSVIRTSELGKRPTPVRLPHHLALFNLYEHDFRQDPSIENSKSAGQAMKI